MQQLQCWLRVSSWLDVVNTCWCDVCGGHLQRRWRNIVQQLQRRLRVPFRLYIMGTGHSDVSSGYI